MRNLTALFIILMSVLDVTAQQNHVPNGSFESYTTCPNGLGQVSSRCVGWFQYTTGGNPDYYHTCGSGVASVPLNYTGYQQPAHGNAYVGLVSYEPASSSWYNYKEYAATQITPLLVGAEYEVSMSVNLATKSRHACDDLGAFFFLNGPTSLSTSVVLGVTPQVSYSNYGPITDTANWVRLTKYFIADSAYQYIVIGGFSSYNLLNIDTVNPTGAVLAAYYLIDSVVVKLHDTLALINNDSLLCAGDTINVSYIVANKKQSNNVFSLQLSNSSGSFASPVNIGSRTSDTSGTITAIIPANTATGTGYRLRIVATNFPDTSEISLAIKIGQGLIGKPIANNNTPVCNNDTLKLSANSSTSGVTWSWAGPNGFTSSLQNPTISSPLPANGGEYIVTSRLYGCVAKDTTTAIVFAGSGPAGISATSNSAICTDDTLKLFGTANGSGNTYSWSGPGGFMSNQQNIVLPAAPITYSGDYVLYASNGTCTSRDTVTVLVKPRPQNFGAVYNSPLCTGTALNLMASTTSAGVTYNWSGPNGFSSTSSSPAISGASSVHNGNYYVTATLNGCSLSDTVVVTVKPKPAVPTMNNNGPVCAGETIMLAAASTTGGASYSWSGPNGFASSLQNPTIGNSTTAMSGTYTATATLDGCSSSATTSVIVKPMPTAVTTSSNTPVCAGNNLLVSIGTSTSGSTYSWVGPNSFSSSNLSNTITSASTIATGWYIATVYLNGCSFKDSVYATVNPIPATPTINFNSPICVGETLNLNGGSVTGGSYSWTGPNGFSSTQNNPSRNNVQLTDTGVYKTTVTVNGCPSAEGQARVSINPVPFVTIFSTPMDTICSGQAVTFVALPNNHAGTPQYQWYVNGSLAGTGTSFNTNSLNNQDVIRCDMTEYTKCSAPYKDESNDITMAVMPWLAPSVSITANPTTPLKPDEFITFTAKPVDGGTIPKFQWKRNGQNIVGATGAIWSANTLNDNDDICVELTSTYRCPQPLTANSNCIKVRVLTGVDDVDGNNAWTIHPNPNNGRFTITAKDVYSTEARLEVVNAVGQLVFRDVVFPQLGNISKEVNMDAVAKGIYLLRIYAGDEIIVFKLLVE